MHAIDAVGKPATCSLGQRELYVPFRQVDPPAQSPKIWSHKEHATNLKNSSAATEDLQKLHQTLTCAAPITTDRVAGNALWYCTWWGRGHLEWSWQKRIPINTWRIHNLGLSPGNPRRSYFFLEDHAHITFAHRLQLSSGKPALLVVGNQQERSQGQFANKIEKCMSCA